MSIPVKYNSDTIMDPFSGLCPANTQYWIDHCLQEPPTTAVLTAPWVKRSEAGSTATIVLTAPTGSDEFGTLVLTYGGTGGARLASPIANCFPTDARPIAMEARVKIATAGAYFIGFAKVVADGTALVTTNALTTSTEGAGWIIQTDDKGDAVSTGTGNTATTALADQYTFTAATYYRIGVIVAKNWVEGYVNGTKIWRLDTSATNTTHTAALTPTLSTVTSAKAMTVDWIAVTI